MKAHNIIRHWGNVIIRRRLSPMTDRMLYRIADHQIGDVWRPFGGENWAYGWNMSTILDMKEKDIPGMRLENPDISRKYPSDQEFFHYWVMEKYPHFANVMHAHNHNIPQIFTELLIPTFYLFGVNKTLLISAAGAFMTEVWNPLIGNPYTAAGSSLFFWTLYGAILSLGIPTVSLRGAVQAYMIYQWVRQVYFTHMDQPPNWYAAPEGYTVQHWSHWLDGKLTMHTMHYVGLLTGLLVGTYA